MMLIDLFDSVGVDKESGRRVPELAGIEDEVRLIIGDAGVDCS